jgi:antitoxin component YwqK of YwqJK toxin-antitoxin module
MIGGGFLKQMNDTMRYNRDLLNKHNSFERRKELYKDEIKKKGTEFSRQNLADVKLRVAERLKRHKKQEILAAFSAICILVILISSVIWFVITTDFTYRKEGEFSDKSTLFTTVTYSQPNGLALRVDYFPHGSKAAETLLKNGIRHQHSESYYETGEQFRSALYYKDTLVHEVYFYKSGDTIRNFSGLSDGKVHLVRVSNREKKKEVQFYFYDGKMIHDSYKEIGLNE